MLTLFGDLVKQVSMGVIERYVPVDDLVVVGVEPLGDALCVELLGEWAVDVNGRST